MGVTITVNGKKLELVKSKLKRFRKAIKKRKLIDIVMLNVRNQITLRTHTGNDVNNNPFKTYTTAYAKEEGKTVVNLTQTGAMLNAMTQKALSSTKGKIFFLEHPYKNSKLNTREMAIKHNTGDGVPKREFFGVNAESNKLVLRKYRSEIAKAKKIIKL